MNPGLNNNRTDSRTIDRMAEFHDGRVTIPEEFVDVSQFVVRTPWYTLLWNGRSRTYYNSGNDHLDDEEISFARFGGEEQIYQLRGYDLATDGGYYEIVDGDHDG